MDWRVDNDCLQARLDKYNFILILAGIFRDQIDLFFYLILGFSIKIPYLLNKKFCGYKFKFHCRALVISL